MTEATAPAPDRRSGDGLDVVYVLCLFQVAFLLLAAIGETLLMGNPGYLLLPVIKSVLMLVFAAGAVRRRRWALRALVVLSWLTLVGFVLGLLVGLLPGVDSTVNLVGLLTNVGLPVAIIVLCRPALRVIAAQRRAAKASRLTPPGLAPTGFTPPGLCRPRRRCRDAGDADAGAGLSAPQNPFAAPTIPYGQTGAEQ